VTLVQQERQQLLHTRQQQQLARRQRLQVVDALLGVPLLDLSPAPIAFARQRRCSSQGRLVGC